MNLRILLDQNVPAQVCEHLRQKREEIRAVLDFAAHRLDEEPSSKIVLILLDNDALRGLVRALTGHTVTEARERGWHARPVVLSAELALNLSRRSYG